MITNHSMNSKALPYYFYSKLLSMRDICSKMYMYFHPSHIISTQFMVISYMFVQKVSDFCIGLELVQANSASYNKP